ncbi:MAG TPA: hypothetical protein PL005_09685 [Candidatus Hydrogenedentes bacterium]|nr:hypothetical protein [Candidatus Hydrogenedentota bacterium]
MPPIADLSSRQLISPPAYDYGALGDGTGSVFSRLLDTDYIDNDGDGVSSQNRYYGNNATIADTDHVLEEIRTHGDASGVVPAFSRIVPLVNERLWEDAAYTDAALPVSLAEINSVKRVAQLVLRGGVLPNYPERDGYDNDGDGGYIAKDSTGLDLTPDGAILRRYIRGTLDKDMVDNDFNGYVDENGADYEDADPAVLAYIHANPFLSEGVDEGGNPVYHDGYRPRVYGPGSFETGPDTPFRIAFLPDVTDYAVFLSSVDSGLPAVRNGVSDLTSYIYPAIPGVAPADSPEWAAFVERRWNPGDNVIVTLYVGDSAYGRVADQATYREYDVVNRTVDDIVESPYYVDGFNNYAVDPVSGGLVWLGAEGGTPIDNFRNRVALFPDRRSHWLPDQMGLDFYRALERKHPLYAGDRFGTSNRWEPTDGAYDDWADSPAWYEQVYVPDGSGGMVAGVEPRFGVDVGYSAATPKAHVARLYGHAMAGSPLRMNLVERLWENPPDLAGRLLGNTGPENTDTMRSWDAPAAAAPGKGRQFLENEEVVFPGDNGVYLNHAHALRRSGTDNAPYATLADLMRVPMPLFEHSLDLSFRIPSAQVNIRYQPERDPRVPNYPPGNAAGAVWRQDLSLRAAVLANAAPLLPNRARPMRARMAGLADVMELSALDPVVLSVAEAGFAPLWPNPVQTGYFGEAGSNEDFSQRYAQWNDENSDGIGEAPFYWSPFYLFADGNEVALPYSPFPVFGTIASGATQYAGPPVSLATPSTGWSWPVVINRAFMADWNRPAPVFGTMVPDTANPATSDMSQVERRWPTERRAVMFVSKYDTAAGEANRPEMILTWDAEDGLVNGTYIAYVGTFVPGMAGQLDRLQKFFIGPEAISADGAAALGGDVYSEPPLPLDSTGSVLEPRLAGLLSLDANRDQGSGDRFDPLLALEFVTDRTTASRVAPPQPPSTETLTPEERERIRLGALPHPRDWYPPDPIVGSVPSGVAYHADGDGMILYSHDASMAWRPRLVRVTDNFLALRVRNLGRPDQVACVTCVVLTPAPRTYGRLNVNTAETGRFQEGSGSFLFNPLLGLPGIVKAYDTMTDVTATGAPRFADALDLPSLLDLQTRGIDLPPLGFTPNPALANPLVNQLDPDPDADSSWGAGHEGVASLRLMSLLVSQRPHHPDGRYFTELASLAAGAGEDGILGNESGVLPVRPLSNYRHAEPRFDEVYQRFAGMANLVETRSDMFEILVTVQEGNISDLDGDGRLDYRGRMNAEEFVQTAESSGRAIYERRARKDASEEAAGVR